MVQSTMREALLCPRLSASVLLSSAKDLSACAKLGDRSLIIDLARQRGRASFVGDRDGRRLGALPTATGDITRLAYARAKEAGIDLEPILKKVGLTLHQIEDSGARL